MNVFNIIVIASIITLLLSLLLKAITLLFGKVRNSDYVYYLYFLSFLFLLTGIMLTLSSILLLLIRAIPFEQVQSIVTSSYIEVILSTGSVTITLVAAFLVRPYFKKSRITNDQLDNFIINTLELKDINDKNHKISIGKYEGYVMQCALRVMPEHFAVPTAIKNVIGWVALINKNDKKNTMELHGTYSPWAYAYNYVVDVVGEESLILFFIICGYSPYHTKSISKALEEDLGSVEVVFPVPPSPQLSFWDHGLAAAFKVSAKEQDDLWLHVRIGSVGAITYDKEFKLIDLIKECVSSKKRSKIQKVKNFLGCLRACLNKTIIL